MEYNRVIVITLQMAENKWVTGGISPMSGVTTLLGAHFVMPAIYHFSLG